MCFPTFNSGGRGKGPVSKYDVTRKSSEVQNEDARSRTIVQEEFAGDKRGPAQRGPHHEAARAISRRLSVSDSSLHLARPSDDEKAEDDEEFLDCNSQVLPADEEGGDDDNDDESHSSRFNRHRPSIILSTCQAPGTSSPELLNACSIEIWLDI